VICKIWTHTLAKLSKRVCQIASAYIVEDSLLGPEIITALMMIIIQMHA